MKNLFDIFKFTFKVNYGSAFSGTKGKQIAKIFLFLFIGIYLIGIASGITYLLFDQLKTMQNMGLIPNAESLILVMAFMLGSLVSLLFGILYTITVFCYSKDYEILLALPIKARDILVAKLLNIILFEYITIIPFLIPSIVIYAIFNGVGIPYLLISIILIIFSPVIPLTIASLFVLFLMKIINFNRYKDKITIIGYLLIIFASMSLSSGMSQLYNLSIESTQNIVDLINSIGSYFPPSAWAAKALVGPNTGINLLLYIVVSVAVFYVFFVLSTVMFRKGIFMTQESSNNPKNSKRKREYKVGSSIYSLLIKDVKNMLREPIYLLNAGLSMIFIPLMLLVNINQGGENLNGQIDSIMNWLNSTNRTDYILVGLISMALLPSILNTAVSTCISTEGKNMKLIKSYPISYKLFYKSKLVFSISITIISNIITITALSFVLKVDLKTVLLALIISLIISFQMIVSGMLPDTIKPKLDWKNYQQAIKQNINTLWSFLLVSLNIFILVALFWLLYIKLSISFIITITTICTVSIVIAYVIYNISIKTITKMMSNLKV